MRFTGDDLPDPVDVDFFRLPDLASATAGDELVTYLDDLCAEPCERDIVHFAYLDAGGRQVSPAGRLHNVPRLPRRRDVDDFVDMIRHHALRVKARQVVFVWQTVDDETADTVGVEAWSTGLGQRLGAGPLRLRALHHRTPEGFVDRQAV